MTDLIDAYCSQSHYAEHLEPIRLAIPEERRGKLYAPRETAREIIASGIPCEVGYGTSPSTAPLLTAGYQDTVYGRRPKVLVAHGAQQTYAGVESGSFAGGPGREAVDLFLYPSQRSCDIELARYPNAKAVAVGAPKLDAWSKIPKPGNGVCAVTFHWDSHIRTLDGKLVPEAGTAFQTWRETIEALAKVRPIIGTSHPRFLRELAPWYASIGVPLVPKLCDVLSAADVLLVDNSSAAYEWSALNRPVFFMRGSNWTEAEHGLRFGEELPGPEWLGQLPSGSELSEWINERLGEEAEWSTTRARVTKRVYGPIDGQASMRAATAVLSLIRG